MAQVRAVSALHSRPSSWIHVVVVSSTSLSPFLSLRLPPVLLPLLPSSTSATSSSWSSTRRSWKTCATPLPKGVRAPTTSSTSPHFQSLGIWGPFPQLIEKPSRRGAVLCNVSLLVRLDLHAALALTHLGSVYSALPHRIDRQPTPEYSSMAVKFGGALAHDGGSQLLLLS